MLMVVHNGRVKLATFGDILALSSAQRIAIGSAALDDFEKKATDNAGNIAFAGLAVFVSSHTSNTEVGNGLINFVVFPMMVLSGIFFSYHNFPDWSIPVIQMLPLTMVTDGIRSIFNEGAGYHDVAIPILILTATGVVFFSAGLKIFKWH